jgi:putative ABC transport system permease protein
MKLPWNRRETRHAELDEEIKSHFAMAVRDRVARGESAGEAHAAVRREFGNVTHVKEVTHDAWGGAWLERLAQDLRYAIRSLRRAPTFTIVATLTLALGIGATTAMFTVINAVILRPLPFPEPDRLFTPSYRSPQAMFSPYSGLDDRHFVAFASDTTVFSHMAAYRLRTATLTGAGEPAKVEAAVVSPDFFATLRISPVLGRVFSRDEMRAVASVTILSNATWRKRFAADPRAVGGHVTIDGTQHTIIGVMPPGIGFPAATEVWTPMSMHLNPRLIMFWRTIGRLRDGVTQEQALAAFATRASTFELFDGERRTDRTAAVLPLKQVVVGDASRVLLIFTGAVVLVLLIACANVANLLLMRVTTRDREMAVRAALGAGRWRLVRQLLTESVALSSFAAVIGVGIAWVAVRLFLTFAPDGIVPRAAEVSLDRTALAFTAGLSIFAAIGCGLIPALHATERRLHASLSAGARSIAAGATRFRSALVVGEIAMSLVLLTGAALLLKSFERLRSVDLGFSGANTLAITVDLPATSYRDAAAMRAFFDGVVGRLRALPGAETAGAVNWVPLGGALIRGDFTLEDGRPLPQGYSADKIVVTPGYLRAIGIRLEAGREFTSADAFGAPGVVVISRSVADRFWPKGDAIGKRVAMVDRPTAADWLTIVGIVGDVQQEGAQEGAHAATYIPVAQTTNTFFLDHATFVVRRAPGVDVSSLATSLRQVLREADPNLALETVSSIDERVAATTVRPRFQSQLLLIFSLAAVALAMIGIYGVLAYGVAQRMQELGVRIALGAAPRQVMSIVLRRTAALAIPGIVIGIASAFAFTRVLEKFLFEVSATDAMTFTSVAALITLVAFAAAYGPARRASRVDPMVALRPEG